jgi:glycosyltransferase involved in cell wall biosynthesis
MSPFDMRAGVQALLSDADEGCRLIVTDRYPPNSHGGAELSLHILLKALTDSGNVRVFTQNEHISAPNRYELDGIQVIEVPVSAPWPFHALSAPEFKLLQTKPRLTRMLSKVGHLLKYAFRGDVRHLATRFQLLLRRFTRVESYEGVIDFDQIDASNTSRLLKSVIARLKPSLVHADNYRSMLRIAAVAEPDRTYAIVGLVRDNRFFCSDRSQSMNINGKVCTSCEFECRQDNPFLVSLMRRNRAYRQAVLHQFDRVIVTSRFLEDQIHAIAPGAAINRLPNPAESVDEIDAYMMGVAEDPGLNVLVVGMLNENKGQVPLVRGLAKLVERVPEVKVHFAGRGDRIEKRLHELATEAGLAAHIQTLGFLDREALYQWMKRCQIIALPTVWPEPFGRVPLEAGLASRPVIAYSIAGLKETVQHESTGLLVPHNDIDAFVDALVELARDPAKRREYGRNGRKQVVGQFGVAEIREGLRKIWLDANDRNSPLR